MTKVKFLIEMGIDGEKEIFAFFPDIIFDRKNTKTSYSHIGQHSPCTDEYAKACKEAHYNEYADLLKELIGQGYKDLTILNTQEIEAHRPPTEAEIKFGEGATHYITVALSCILNEKGDIKKWFVYPGDKLRYSTR